MDRFAVLQDAVNRLEPKKGISALDVIEFPEPLRVLFLKIMGSSYLRLEEISELLGIDPDMTLEISRILVEKGFLIEQVVENPNEPVFRIFLARTRAHNLPKDLF